MQLQNLTEEPTVAILPIQQREPMPAPLEAASEAEAMQTNVEPEVTQSETVVQENIVQQETVTSIEVTLSKMQRLWKYGIGLNVALNFMGFMLINMTSLGTFGHLSHLHASQYSGIVLADLGIAYFEIALGLFTLMLVCGALKIPVQSKLNMLTRTVAELDDIRAIGPLTGAFNVQHRKRHRKLRDLILAALTRLLSLHSDELKAAGPLAEALLVGDRKLRAEVVAALTPLLLRLHTEDAAQFSPEQLKALNAYVGRIQYTLGENDIESPFGMLLYLLNSRRKIPLPPDEKALALAIVAAYPVIGDGKELPIVRMIAGGEGNAGKDAEVRQAAQAYLELVANRKKEEKLNTTLLRASSVIATSSTILLRAANATPSTPPEELLRPTTSEINNLLETAKEETQSRN